MCSRSVVSPLSHKAFSRCHPAACPSPLFDCDRATPRNNSRPFPYQKTYLRLITALLGIALLSVGCTSIPSNANLTLIESVHSLDSAFLPDASFPSLSTNFLSYDEITQLAMHGEADSKLKPKLDPFWRTPMLCNAAWDRGVRPLRQHNATLGPFLNIATWNIEQSRHLDTIADVLSCETAYLDLWNEPWRNAEASDLLRQRQRLADADILVMQEVDIGHPRSGYRHGAEYLAQALDMNYAYAPAQLELGPVLSQMELKPDPSLTLPTDEPADPDQYHGIFGLLVLSKYPIKFAECFQLETQPYDWYAEELAQYDAVEDIRKFGTQKLFHTEIQREIKAGGRIYFRVDLEVPGLPEDTLTIIHVHLEIKSRPEGRLAQMQEILSYIRDIPHPVVLLGDFNSTRYDVRPTSLPRFTSALSRSPNFWIWGGVNLLAPAQAMLNTLRTVLNELKNLHNPLAFNNPLVFPNSAYELFSTIEAFRFDDGGRFDFRGERSRSINQRSARLANSNEKAFKGYRTTFAVKRPIGPFGRERLDWIFVKSGCYTDSNPSYQLAPHFGETLDAFHDPLPHALSDHRPCVVHLPLHEPPGFPK